jgi:RecA-family ATPase
MTVDRNDEAREMDAADSPSALAGMVNGAWLDAQQFPALNYAVPGIIPEGMGVLVGPPKVGKSWLVANIGLAVAAGGRALGSIPVTQRPVLYLALEDGHRRLQSRFRAITAGTPLPADIHVIINAQSYQVIPMVTEFLAVNADVRPLVVLDTLGKVKPARRPGDDPYQQDYALGSRLKQAADETAPGSTLLVVHHTRKAESEDFVDAVSGTQGIAGAADFVIVLKRKRHRNEALLAVTGRDIPENEYAAIADDGVLWRLDGSNLTEASRNANKRHDEHQLSDRTQDVLTLVNSRSEARAVDLDEVGVKPDQGRVYLSRLNESGRIRKLGRGVYGPLEFAITDESVASAEGVCSVASVTSPQPAEPERNGSNRTNTDTEAGR